MAELYEKCDGSMKDPRHDHGAALLHIATLNRRVADLEARLEVYAGDEAGMNHSAPLDGIACRDETIRGLKERIAELERLIRQIIEAESEYEQDYAIENACGCLRGEESA